MPFRDDWQTIRGMLQRGEEITPVQVVAYISKKARRSETVFITRGVKEDLSRIPLTIRHVFDGLRKDPKPHGRHHIDKYGDCLITVKSQLHGPGAIMVNVLIAENGTIWVKAVSLEDSTYI